MSVSATTPRDQHRADLVGLLTQICETPAPTFAEEARGELIASLLKAEGLEPHTDEVGNVSATLGGGQGPRLLVAAHLDTVFGADTDVTVRTDRGPDGKERLKAPGIGDNSASLAVLMHYVRQIQRHGANPERPRLSVAATVGEEGLGDLYGVRHLMETRADEFDLVLALDGHLGIIVNESVGSKRFEITFTARGGHSWGDYPSPSATHALGDAIAALNKLQVPGQPRSSYNVGQISGGTSINAIAESARFNLDLRSLDKEVLERLTRESSARIERTARQHRVTCEIKQVGDRPTARVPNGALVRSARDALGALGMTPRLSASSTDANAAMDVGLPAIAFGVYRGGDAHRLSEWLEPDSLVTGYRAFERLLANLSHLPGS